MTDQSYVLSPSSQQHDTFARLLVHDMRNPLSGIVLYTQLLQRQGEYNAEQQRCLAQIQAEAQRLRTLLDQMELINKLQQGTQPMRRQLTDLRPLLRNSVSKCSALLPAQDRELRVTIPNAPMPQLLVNRPLIQQLLEILLSHALRFTPAHTGVTVEMAICANTRYGDAPLVQISMMDQGPPIPEQVLANLYEAVERWDVTVSARAGAGLALALCKMIAEAHEGTLLIANHRPNGVRFVVTLPIAESEWRPYDSWLVS